MRKRTSLRTPKNPKASPNQTSGLIAKGQNPGQSVQEECVLDNRSHRTFRASEPAHRFVRYFCFLRSITSADRSQPRWAGWVEGRQRPEPEAHCYQLFLRAHLRASHQYHPGSLTDVQGNRASDPRATGHFNRSHQLTLQDPLCVLYIQARQVSNQVSPIPIAVLRFRSWRLELVNHHYCPARFSPIRLRQRRRRSRHQLISDHVEMRLSLLRGSQ